MKKNVILLHGALGSKRYFAGLKKELETDFNPNYALELRYEGQKCNKISRFNDFSIAPLW